MLVLGFTYLLSMNTQTQLTAVAKIRLKQASKSSHLIELDRYSSRSCNEKEMLGVKYECNEFDTHPTKIRLDDFIDEFVYFFIFMVLKRLQFV